MEITPTHRIVAEIRAEMARQGITPTSVAERADMPRGTLWRKLNGRSEFTIDEAARVAAVLDVSLADLAQRAEALAS